MSRVSEKKAERIPAAERREQMLEAAGRVFGAHGYAGATTDVVARQAGISQPYVVRMFGGKDKLLVEVLNRAVTRLLDTFREVIDQVRAEQAEDQLAARLARAYIDLIEDDTVLLPMMHGFLLGHHPAIGPCARKGFLAVYRLLRDEAGFDADVARDFLAHGMLMNTVIALGIPSEYESDPISKDLIDSCFGAKTDLVLRAAAASHEGSDEG
jgi:TetR/AcrR family transcriptional regulator